LQDAYIAAFRRAGSFRGESAVTTWLHRVVVNAYLDRLPPWSRETEHFEDLDRWSRMGTTLIKDPVNEGQRGIVAAAVGVLNADQRAAPMLVDTEDTPSKQRILGCAPGTVKSRCADGRARVLPLLGRIKAERGS
jgi:RNA polymerase sigma-70 factor (ECF subfamily)